ncbi:phycobilisome rod-core linker polypeptide [Cyanobium sp. Morenito 9A2]|uniref:phycobilisome rod-core linker polypeptide n=1 Tax=Cyanobium sp. Morenito 9A2 TaxID=2823718 RepID=UPI0020CD7AC1|nr:phycobilisome rod-core linker polypeptide [Cyanobium sp. Morenito 9A2]MCP9848627.1 phycobilisome rod-core linker polypeptide [Cyanobium sp. Morenito 9A2]
MTLIRAPYLGIERFANDRYKEGWITDSDNDKSITIRAVYQQVLGHQYLMQSERLEGAESLFRNGYYNVRELVRAVAKSGQYRSRFFENCNPYRFIELNHKHLLGRAPHNRDEMLHHFTILQEQGVDAEIDSYIDSPEYQERFGLDVVPYIHGWDYSAGLEGRQFSWLMQLARGAAASVKGDAAGTRFRLGGALHQNRAMPVVSPSASEGPFRSVVSSGLAAGDINVGGAHALRSPAQAHRVHGLQGASGRTVTLHVSGIASLRDERSADVVWRVPLARFNQAIQRANRLGGRITQVSVA